MIGAPALTLDESAPPPLERIVEALLFVGGPPLTAARACETIRGLAPEQFALAIATLDRDYRAQGRPYRVGRRDQGYELVLRPAFCEVRRRLSGGQTRRAFRRRRSTRSHSSPTASP